MRLNADQTAALLAPLDASRVKRDPKGFSYLEAWDVRCTMNVIFGIGQWSLRVLAMELLYDESHPSAKDNSRTVYDVAYRAHVEVSINTAEYSEWATGAATNYPNRGDAHDQAIKTAESQAFKRACVNLGDQFGLSLYRDGEAAATVAEGLGRFESRQAIDAYVQQFAEVLTQDALDELTAEVTAVSKNLNLSDSERLPLRKALKAAQERLKPEVVQDSLPASENG